MFDSVLKSIYAMSYGSMLILAIIVGFVAANAKSLPFAHSLRLLPSLYQLLRPRLSSSKCISSQTAQIVTASYDSADPALFKHNVMTSRAIAFDLDVNMHKSNSTFFADADISRARLLTNLLSSGLAKVGPANFVLAGAQCKFQREIRPYQAYTVSSRILAWNDKTLYVVTYFLKIGATLPYETEVLGGPAALTMDERLRKSVFATMVTKYVFKAGRTTVAPEHVFRAAGLLLDSAEKRSNAQPHGGLRVEDVRGAVDSGLKYVAACME